MAVRVFYCANSTFELLRVIQDFGLCKLDELVTSHCGHKITVTSQKMEYLRRFFLYRTLKRAYPVWLHIRVIRRFMIFPL